MWPSISENGASPMVGWCFITSCDLVIRGDPAWRGGKRRGRGASGQGTEVLKRGVPITLSDVLPGGEDVTNWFRPAAASWPRTPPSVRLPAIFVAILTLSAAIRSRTVPADTAVGPYRARSTLWETGRDSSGRGLR